MTARIRWLAALLATGTLAMTGLIAPIAITTARGAVQRVHIL